MATRSLDVSGGISDVADNSDARTTAVPRSSCRWSALTAQQESLHATCATFDNGKEFAAHERITARLAMPVYFAKPYCSWQRGTNENTNGLLRQYIPKGTDFRQVSWQELARYTCQLNDRPRKRLGYRTPAEILEQLRCN